MGTLNAEQINAVESMLQDVGKASEAYYYEKKAREENKIPLKRRLKQWFTRNKNAEDVAESTAETMDEAVDSVDEAVDESVEKAESLRDEAEELRAEAADKEMAADTVVQLTLDDCEDSLIHAFDKALELTNQDPDSLQELQATVTDIQKRLTAAKK